MLLEKQFAPDMATDACPALLVENISAGYQGVRNAIYDVSFRVETGERIGILGPNGAGKSTLFKALTGLIPHQTGRVSLDGQDCQTSHKRIGYVSQREDIDLSFPVTVADVVMMGRLRQIGWFRLPTSNHWRRVDELLERVGMQDFKHRQIGQLSGGQRRRVFIARALAQETTILLLDEPFSGVDVTAEQEIFRVLENLRDEGVTIIVATHDFHAAATQFDKLLLLNKTVIAFGKPDKVLVADTLSQAYGGRIGIFGDGQATFVIADEHGCC